MLSSTTVEVIGFAGVSPTIYLPSMIILYKIHSNQPLLQLQRIYAIHQYPDTTKPPYIINVLFPLVAPALYAASIYMALGRILIITGGESYSLVPTKWLTKIFVFGDVASFVLVGIGAYHSSSNTISSS